MFSSDDIGRLFMTFTFLSQIKVVRVGDNASYAETGSDESAPVISRNCHKLRTTVSLLNDTYYSPLDLHDFTNPTLFVAAVNESQKYSSVKRHLDSSKPPFNKDQSE